MTQLDWSYFKQNQKPTLDVLRRYENNKGVQVISPADKLCNDSGCTTTINGEFIYRDEGHFRRDLKSETLAILGDYLQFHQPIAEVIENSRPK
jgi:hypothetical protein